MKTTTPKKQFLLRPDGSMLTPEFRVSFPHVFEPNKEGKFGLAMIFDEDVDFAVLEKEVAALIKEKYPKGAPKGLMQPILDGGDSDREELLGKMYINGKCGKYRPGLVGPDKKDIVDAADFYPGCWARASITIYAWTYLGKCGISVNVRNIQKTRDGEPLIGRVSAANEFDAVSSEATDL